MRVSSQHSRHVLDGTSGASHGAGHLGSSDPGRVAHVDLVDAPAGERCAQDHFEWPAEPAILDAQSEQVESSHRAHRSEVGADRRACGGEAPTRETDSRRGRASATNPCDARRAPITRSASPASTGAATAMRSAPSKEPSQSMKQTTSSVAARRPVQHAAPNPRRGSNTTCAP